MTLTPSYGRDYKSKAAVLADFDAGKDFTIASVGRYMGAQCSKSDLAGQTVTIRYARLTKCVVVDA